MWPTDRVIIRTTAVRTRAANAFALLIVACVVTHDVHANADGESEPTAGRLDASRVCRLHEDERSVDLVRLRANSAIPCEVQQRRAGEVETLWRAENDGEYCVRAFNRYLRRLASLGFDCGTNTLDRAAAGFD